MNESENKITIGWYIGLYTGQLSWAFKALATHIIEAMPDFNHVINEPGDVNVILAVVHLPQHKSLANRIIHIDGNRWYARGDSKPDL